MRTGIIGGTFNPPHNAHIRIARFSAEEYNLDRVIFMTSGNPPHKSDILDARHRYNMVRLAIEGEDKFETDDFEITRPEKSYTVHTLEYLKKKYPSDELFFIIGEDSAEELSLWYKPERITELATLLVFPRISKETLDRTLEEVRQKYGKNIFPIDAPVTKISSTDIRERIRNAQNVDGLICGKVADYIKTNRLYEER